jgi:hypothetical protein
LIISPHSRFFVREFVTIRPHRGHGLPLPLYDAGDKADAFSVFQKAAGSESGEVIVSSADVVRLSHCELRLDERVAIFLLRRSDPAASTPFFEVPTTKMLRKSDKRPDEALAVSAHLFVSLDPILGANPSAYRAIREEIPSLGRSYIEDVLAKIVRGFPYSYKDHHDDMHETHSILEISGVKSERLTDVLHRSSVQQVTLRRMGNIEGMDSEGLFVPREETFKLYIKASQDNIPRALAKIKEFARVHNWDDVVVRVDLPEKRSRTVALERDAAAAEALFVRAEQIDVPTALEVCTDRPNEDLLKHAVERLSDANWG